jgi:putative salt-induced outer membrane protein YdiY
MDMKMKMKLLDMTLIGLLSAGVLSAGVSPAMAQDAQPEGEPRDSTATTSAAQCNGDECRSGEGLLFRVRTRGEERPVAVGADADALQQNRRVDVIREDLPGTAKIAGKFAIDLPNGGVIWATEDPALGAPILNVQSGSTAPFENGRIAKPLRFHGYTNYASFIRKLEVTVYRGTDVDLATPLATIELPVSNVSDVEWNGVLPADLGLHPGDELLYVARAYGTEGTFDETQGQRIQLVKPEDYERGVQALRDDAQRTLGHSVADGADAQSQLIANSIYGQSTLRLQNIPIHGSRVRIFGRDIARDTQLTINGQSFPIDLERKFVAEFLEPIGAHSYAVMLKTGNGAAVEKALDVNVTGKYAFLVALADVTLSDNNASGNVEPLAGDERFDDDFIAEGRLAFYLKGKVKGKYLVTAQADTREREVSELFDGFLDADPQDVFRRLDPDQYYPVYGDDSTTYRDVDTQGKLYVRVDWDRNQALWGNFNTGITGTEYAQYQRSLYGAALNWRSRGTTQLGDPKSELRAFGSEAQTALGHTEFLGTGGSLYYLRHTDVLAGSDKLTLEVRDRTTGRTEARVDLQRGADYEIDELQGRLILTRPLAQVTRENVRTLTRDAPLDGYEQLLLADYEYVPVGFDNDDASLGLRGKQWFGEHLAIGGTWVDENRSGDDYSVKGVDLTLQAGRGTYLKAEQTRTEATVAPLFYSDNGGLSFVQRNATVGARRGDATAVEARANFKELGWTEHDWSVGAWWRDLDAGYSVSRFDNGLAIEEWGAEFLGYFTQRFSLFGRHSRAERGNEALEQSQLTADWRITDNARFGAELRRVREQHVGSDLDATLAALSYRQRIGSMLELYGIAQGTLDHDDGYENNNLLTLGARYLFGDRSSVGAEVSSGSRGHGGKLEAEYRMSQDHTLYGAYGYSTDSTERDPLFNSALQNGWTLGQRWRLGSQVNLFNESQFLKDTRAGTSGIAHTFGMDFYPAEGWNTGFSVMDGELDAATGQVHRRAYGVSGGRTDERTQWSSKLEYRKDSGAEQREQWVTTNRLFLKINEDWRLAARVNYADTQDDIIAAAGAKLAETNIGFAWRPHDNTRWAAFGKYTYLYDLATMGQEGGASFDQKSHVLALEGIHQFDANWELAGKLASRWGEYRMGRDTGAWLDGRADFAAAQMRYHLVAKWEGLAEYRWLGVRDGGDRKGWLVGVDRQIGENFKVGVGYNFTDFSDDLTDLEYDNKGWFLNLAGYY